MLIGALLLLPLGACSPVFYAPNIANAPLLRDRGDLRVSGHVGGGDAVESMYQASVAWSFTTRLGVYGSLYGASGSRTDGDGTTTSGTGHVLDIAAGYHKRFSRGFGFEALAGVQHGSGENNYRDAYQVNYSSRKPFGQLNVGYRGRIFEAVFAQRLSRLTYTRIAETLGQHPIPRPTAVADLIAASPSVLYEPSISLRVGRDPWKFTFDLSGSHNRTNPDLRMDEAVVALGLVYSVKLR